MQSLGLDATKKLNKQNTWKKREKFNNDTNADLNKKKEKNTVYMMETELLVQE